MKSKVEQNTIEDYWTNSSKFKQSL